MRRLASGDSIAESSHNADGLRLVQQAGFSKRHLLPLGHPDPRPADSLEILGSALLGLKTAVASDLPNNEPFPSSLASFPSFPGLPYDLIADAFKYADIHLLGDKRVSPVGAAAAANGLGLCSRFVEPDKCEAEEWTMPTKRVLAVEYTKMALTVTVSPFRASRKGYDWIILREWDLGSDSEPPTEDEDSRQQSGVAEVRTYAENYWRRVRHLIQRLPAEQSAKNPITEVIGMGESVLEEKFIDAMRDALKNIIDESVPVYLFNVDPTFAAARGAAEFGKRAMESPNDCVETAVCKYWRRFIGGTDVLGPSCRVIGLQ